ncbi:hypothetical protein EXIGLDRAFT_842529 [Exidia glandulosa HHB12029]|uniref:Uncharacterized protein n=1 Tax=Exidia glandulosa HHB12029 TaxID=1314781 RepID=A0A165D8K0_EXIGL|nr:hypothetical protein EXIGLDRAFT_842529 [Exidia glandulosa HHB12029]
MSASRRNNTQNSRRNGNNSENSPPRETVEAMQRRIRELENENSQLENENQDKEDALREHQRELHAQQQELTQAERRLADATNRPSARASKKRHRQIVESPPNSGDEGASPPPPKRPHSDDYIPSADDERAVANLGRKFTILYGMWFPSANYTSKVDDVLLLDYDPAFNVSSRFNTNATKAQGQLHDIYKLCEGEELFRYRKDSWFRRSFNYGVRQQVSDTANRLRSHCWEIFGSDVADHLRDPQDRFDHFARRIGYRPGTAAKDPYYSTIDCPFLHSTGCDTFDLEDAYTNDEFCWIMVAITRGPEAARQARLSDGKEMYIPPTTVKGDNLKISRTTAGAIAACVTFYKYTFSRDVELRPRGKTTGIEYKADFDEHLEHILKMHHDKVPSMMELFKKWDYKVFGIKEDGDHTRPDTAADRRKEEHDRLRTEMRAKLNALRREREQNGDQDDEQNGGLGREERREMEDDPDAGGN